MMTSDFKILLSLLLVICLAAPAQASVKSAEGVAVQSDGQRRFTKIGLIMSAAITKDAAERADERILIAYRELDVMRQRAVAAEGAARQATMEAKSEKQNSLKAVRSAREAQAHADRFEAEAVRLRADQVTREEAWIAELARRDLEFAAAQKVFAEHMSNIVERNDPRINMTLERYLKGDVSALNELAEYASAVVVANLAAVEVAKQAVVATIEQKGRKRNGDLLRSVAAIWTDAADKGQKSIADALTKWQEAARIDPDNFEQWHQLFKLAYGMGENGMGLRAANELWTRAQSVPEKVTACRACSIVEGKRCDPEWESQQYRQEMIRLQRVVVANNPNSPLALLELATSLSHEGMFAYSSDARGLALKREALMIVEELRQKYPSSNFIELSYIAIATNAGVSIAPGAERDRFRALLERGVALARVSREKAPDSWLLTYNLANALMNLSKIADADRNEVLSVSLTNESIDLLERMQTKDGLDLTRKTGLWHAYTVAGMSAHVYAAFDREREYYRKALAIGRLNRAGYNYMVNLTLPRLAGAELAHGNINAARILLTESIKQRTANEQDKIGEAEQQSNLILGALMLAQYAWIEQDYATAAQGIRAMYDALNNASQFSALSKHDRLFLRALAAFKLSLVLLEQERYSDISFLIKEFLNKTSAIEVDPDLRGEARFISVLFKNLGAEIPGSGIHWKGITAPSMDGLNPDRFHGDMARFKQFIARRQALEEAELDSQSPKELVIASLRKSYQVYSQLISEEPPSESGYAGLLTSLKFRAHAGDTEASWQLLAEEYLHLHKYGWITTDSVIDDMYFVLARAEIHRRKKIAIPPGVWTVP